MKTIRSDQNLINTVFHYNHDKILFLPCRWNYHHKFCFDSASARSCPEADEHGAAIAHGNAKTFTNNYSPVFKVCICSVSYAHILHSLIFIGGEWWISKLSVAEWFGGASVQRYWEKSPRSIRWVFFYESVDKFLQRSYVFYILM